LLGAGQGVLSQQQQFRLGASGQTVTGSSTSGGGLGGAISGGFAGLGAGLNAAGMMGGFGGSANISTGTPISVNQAPTMFGSAQNPFTMMA
jgi:hypothetical protein